MNDIVEGGGRHTRPRVDDTSFFRGYAAQTVADFAKDLCYWAIQPHPQPLPEGWADSYRRRLEELRGLVQRNFAGVGAVIRDLQQFEDDARELIVILHSDPQISMQPVQNWPIRAYQEAFERVMEWQQRFRQLAVKLNAQYEQTREELDQWREANRQAAFSSYPVAEPVGAADATGGDVYPNSSTVTAEQLALHAGVSSRKIRDQLKDSLHEIDNRGRKLFDYASVLPVLQNWCKNTRTRKLNSIQWPTLAENLKTLRPERKKK